MNHRLKPRGQSLVESALILTAFMGMLVGMAGVAESLFVRQTLADRARMAARWGALHSYDPDAIRAVALYGTAAPATGDAPFFRLTPAAIEVSNPGCPGPTCLIRVVIPEHGISSVQPVEAATPALVASRP